MSPLGRTVCVIAEGQQATALGRQIGSGITQYSYEHPVSQLLNVLGATELGSSAALGQAGRLADAAEAAARAGNLSRATAYLRQAEQIARIAAPVQRGSAALGTAGLSEALPHPAPATFEQIRDTMHRRVAEAAFGPDAAWRQPSFIEQTERNARAAELQRRAQEMFGRRKSPVAIESPQAPIEADREQSASAAVGNKSEGVGKGTAFARRFKTIEEAEAWFKNKGITLVYKQEICGSLI